MKIIAITNKLELGIWVGRVVSVDPTQSKRQMLWDRTTHFIWVAVWPNLTLLRDFDDLVIALAIVRCI